MAYKRQFACSCGKVHDGLLDEYLVESGAIGKLAHYVKKYGGSKVFVLCDKNTFAAAGQQVVAALEADGIDYSLYMLQGEHVHPDEQAMGSVALHYDHSCDMVVGVGSGVINDLGKMISAIAKVPYIIVATAPSMDGYASSTSSMDVDGWKVSLKSRCANVVIGDTQVLKKAPKRMMISGLGDMLAKYVSICEWRCAQLIVPEYYCEEVASMVRQALKKCTDNAAGLLQGEDAAVEAVFEGLIISGVAMSYVGISRPASGVEHYVSHVLDMRNLEFNTPVDLHGIQCGVATRYAVGLYEKLRQMKPDREKALRHAADFSKEAWNDALRCFLGRGAEAMIAAEEKDGKYNPENHALRLNRILEHWDTLLQIMEEELPAAEELEALLDTIEAPKTLADIGVEESLFPMIFRATKDIRYKYVLSTLAWDLGVLEELLK